VGTADGRVLVVAPDTGEVEETISGLASTDLIAVSGDSVAALDRRQTSLTSVDIEDAHLVSAAGGDGASATGTAGGSDVTPSEGGRMADGGTGSVAGDGGRVNAGGTTDAGYGGGGGGDVPSAGAGNPRSPCDDYCSVVTRDCTGKDAQFIDADACQQACRLYPPGTPGEVVIRGITQLDGYWNNSVATVEAIRDGWYYTGDVGISDEQGYIFLVDRKKDMIISGGENIYSREVESALAEHPEVADAAVIGVPDPRWLETVKAVVVLKRDAVVTEAELIAHCKTLIASYKCPKSIEFTHELPRLSSGKINKVELRTLYR
jgi:acyl-CoA synthetase (AMP-forming)/AMP-acid ligase II